MYEPGIEKLRRFSLVVALVLLTYSVAGISLKPNSEILVIGLTFNVSRPEWLPVSLVIASIFSIIRFYYYGFMLKKSPYRLRRDAIEGLYTGLRIIRGELKKELPLYFNFGPIKDVESRIWDEDKNRVQRYVDDFPNVFPKCAGARASARLTYKPGHDEDGEPTGTMFYGATVSIPIWCRLAAIFQDIDYSSPIWLNLISLAIYSFRH
jgi:hypothetical protein